MTWPKERFGQFACGTKDRQASESWAFGAYRSAPFPEPHRYCGVWRKFGASTEKWHSRTRGDEMAEVGDTERGRISTGCAGLDDILGGGLDPNRIYLVEGRPGSGKTTLAMQFLLEGLRQDERVLYVAMSETKQELELIAKRHGWPLAGLDIFELVPAEAMLDPEKELTVLHPAEVDLSETTREIFSKVAEVDAKRVVIDSLSELRLLAQEPLRYRRQVLALKHHFARCNCTVLLLDDLTAAHGDQQLHSMVHGVVLLEQLAIDYGAQRRRISIPKMRGIQFQWRFSRPFDRARRP